MWRELYKESFLSKFDVNVDRTREYVERYYVAAPNRILFLIQSDVETAGHIGLTNITTDAAELDNVVRRPNLNVGGLMLESGVALLSWAFEELGVEEIKVRVLSNNVRARNFYQKLGFSFVDTSELKRIQHGADSVLYQCATGDGNVQFGLDNFVLSRTNAIR